MDDRQTGMDARYDEDYFLRGKQSGKSLYENYRWLPNLTIPMCEVLTEHCGIELGDRILDFGCARGYIVKALVSLGYDAIGTDVSKWALENCDPSVKHLVRNEWPPNNPVDWIIAKDVLEHISLHNISRLLLQMAAAARKGVFIVVPLAKGLGQRYAVDEYEADVTHSLRWPLDQWMDEVLNAFDHTWEVSCRYRIAGIKDNYAQWVKGNGFITCRRIG
jgi:methyltransferase family protein